MDKHITVKEAKALIYEQEVIQAKINVVKTYLLFVQDSCGCGLEEDKAIKAIEWLEKYFKID